MMKTIPFVRLLVVCFFIPTLFFFLYPSKIVGITMICSYPVFFVLVKKVMILSSKNIRKYSIVFFFVLINLILFLRGIFDANSYQDWTTLISSSVVVFLILPLVVFLGTNIVTTRTIFRTYLYYVIPLSFILLTKKLYGQMDFAHTVAGVCFFLIWLPLLNRKQKIVILAITFISFFNDVEVRANMLNILVALLFGFLFFIRKYGITKKFIRAIWLVLIFSPVFFLVLGLTGIFNVFKVGELIGSFHISSEQNRDNDIFVDSRTAIYEDVFYALVKQESIFYGLGASGKTHTTLSEKEAYSEIYKEGRRGTESGMLNFIQYGGVIGAFSYYLLFLISSYNGVFKSRNWGSLILGLWIAFKCFFSFIEDRLMFTPYSLFIFIPIGMCLNKHFRNLDNQEVTFYLRSFLNNTDYNKYLYLRNVLKVGTKHIY